MRLEPQILHLECLMGYLSLGCLIVIILFTHSLTIIIAIGEILVRILGNFFNDTILSNTMLLCKLQGIKNCWYLEVGNTVISHMYSEKSIQEPTHF